MFACFIIQIFFRYVLNNPVGWTEEVIITVLALDGAVGRGLRPREAEEIRFDIIYSTTSPNACGGSSRSSPASRSSALRHLAAGCLQYVSLHEGRASAYLHVPINWLYSVYVIFAVACIVPLLLAGLSRHPWRQAAGRRMPPRLID